MHFSNESRKRKTNFPWPLTLIMQKRDHFRLLRHHYSESPVIPLSNGIWYRCVAHGFITFYFLIFYRWSTEQDYILLFSYSMVPFNIKQTTNDTYFKSLKRNNVFISLSLPPEISINEKTSKILHIEISFLMYSMVSNIY